MSYRINNTGGISIKALRRKYERRSESGVTATAVVALLDAIEAAEELDSLIPTNRAFLDDPMLYEAASKLHGRLARFDFGSEASR